MSSFVNLIDQRRLIGPGGSTVSGDIYFYYTTTSVLAPVFYDAAMTVPAPNPISVGAGDIVPLLFLDDTITYRRVIVYSDGTRDEVDPLNPIGSGGSGTEEAGIPIGGIIDFAGVEAPEGFLLCYGQTVSREEYADLFAAIGTTYGAGNGVSTFTLPDGRGRVIAGKDNMGGISADRLNTIASSSLGGAGGEQTHSLTHEQNGTHNHFGATGPSGNHSHTGTVAVAYGNYQPASSTFEDGAGSPNWLVGAIGAVGDHIHSIPLDGSGLPHNNIQPTLILNKIIKYSNAGSISLDAVIALAESAWRAAHEAELSAAYAESMTGPTYDSIADGLANTEDGDGFAVDNGDGTVTVYINEDGSAVEQRTLATTAALELMGGQMVQVAPERPYPSAPSLLTTDDAFEFGARLTRYGFKGDGSSDDTQAWRDAIEEARTRPSGAIRNIIVPAGISIVESAIVDSDNQLPHGLHFIGEGRTQMAEYEMGSVLRYTGDETAWDIFYDTGGPASIGDWLWRDMSFWCSDPDGTMFDFGKTLTHTPGDGGTDPYRFLQRIEFERIYAVGPYAGINQNGDFIRACKTFALSIDDQSVIRAFRRGIWLKGCDNCVIDSHFYGNVRHIHMERPVGTTFGNQLEIGSAFLGELFEGPEDSYCVYDNGLGTVIKAGALFEATGVPAGGNCVAHLYLNGLGTQIEKPVMSFAPLFHLGPDARQVTLVDPVVTVFEPSWAPIIDAPSSWDFGASPTDRRIRVEKATHYVRAIIGRNPRILYPGNLDGTFPSSDTDHSGIARANGYQRPFVCSALNYWGLSAVSVGGQPIKGIEADTDSTGGYAIVLDRTVTGSGFSLRFGVGTDITKGRHRLSLRCKNADGWTVAYRQNSSAGVSIPATTGSTYGRTEYDIDTSSWTVNDVLEVYIYNPGATLTADMSIDFVSLDPFIDALVEGQSTLSSPWTAFTSFGNTGPRFSLGEDRIVSITGAVQSGSTGLIFTLPPGYRPNKPLPLAAIAFDISTSAPMLAHLEVGTDGTVTCYTDVTGHWLSLGSIMFRAA